MTQQKVALVTGASRGIGYATALELAKAGYHVVAVARTQGGLEELDDAVKALGGTATLVPLDLTDFDAIDRLGASLYERFGHLDVLVGCAAQLGSLMPIHHYDAKKFQQIMDINVMSQWRLLRSLDPLFRGSAAANVLFMTSSVGHDVRPYWGAYAVSKAALEMVVDLYAAENESTNMRIFLYSPGATYTAMRRAAMPGEDPDTLKKPIEVGQDILRLFDNVDLPSGSYDYQAF